MKKRVLVVFLLIPIALFAQGGGQPINIPVTSSGWVFGNNTGPYGTNGCYAGNGTDPCVQDLGISPSQLQEYKPGYTKTGFFTVSFTMLNYFGKYPGYWTYQIDFGTQELCEHSGWGEEVVDQITSVCPSPGYLIVDQALPGGGPVQGKKNLVLSLHGSTNALESAWIVQFDKVSVTFTPSN